MTGRAARWPHPPPTTVRGCSPSPNSKSARSHGCEERAEYLEERLSPPFVGQMASTGARALWSRRPRRSPLKCRTLSGSQGTRTNRFQPLRYARVVTRDEISRPEGVSHAAAYCRPERRPIASTRVQRRLVQDTSMPSSIAFMVVAAASLM
eukprot:7273327-Pyramimonas_sp.AAC.1